MGKFAKKIGETAIQSKSNKELKKTKQLTDEWRFNQQIYELKYPDFVTHRQTQ